MWQCLWITQKCRAVIMWQGLLCLVLTCQEPSTNFLRDVPTVKVTTINHEPFMISKVQGGHEGLLYDILSYVGSEIGLNFEFNVVKDGRYGYYDDQGGWTGMIGEVVRGDADLAAADITISPQRALAVDWTIPFMQSGIVALTTTDDSGSVPASLEELVDKVDTIYVFGMGSTHRFLKDSTDPLVVRLGEKLETVTTNMDALEKIKADKGTSAMMMESGSAGYLAGSDCSLKIVGEPLNTVNYALALQKGAAIRKGSSVVEYRTLLNWALVKMQSSGELKKVMDKWFKKDAC